VPVEPWFFEAPWFSDATSPAFKTPGGPTTLAPVKVLVVGSGGREHALAWKLAQSPELEELHAAPGNPGIARLGTCHPVRAEDGEGLLDLAHMLRADLVVVGPEAPLVAGVANHLRHAGVAVFGPSAAAARIEGSKAFAKDVMRAAGVPTAETMSVARPPCVVKADGLAAGKGVFVCRTQEELDAALRAVSTLGEQWVIEELVSGEELSVFAVCDGSGALPLGVARDYKRVGDGDTGPNTGGMGAFSPVPDFGPDEVEDLVEAIHAPVLAELGARGAPFVGLLYAGLMLTADGPRVLEFNCRFGDPETQAILPRVEGDFLGALHAAANGDLGEAGVSTAHDVAAVTVVVAGERYPEAGDTGTPIEGIEAAEAGGALVFQAGTAVRDGRVVTNGGRILNVTAVGETLEDARTAAYEACGRISFPGMRYRTDIGQKVLNVAG
jgi:phosphoribosylamine--glycine ligase